MKKLLSFLLVVGLVIALSSSACAQERYTPLKTKTVVAKGNVFANGIDIYRIMFNTTAATGGVGIYDKWAHTDTTGGAVITDIAFEIYEAADGEGHYIDFGDNPLKLDDACYVEIFDGALVLHYR